MKKNNNLSELMSYAGRHRYLTYLSLALSVISAILSLLPFVFIFFIIKEIIEVVPNYSEAVNISRNGWLAVLFALIAIVIYICALMCSHLSAFTIARNMRKTLMSHIKSELGVAMFVVPAQMIMKLGIATVALVGSMLLINGTLSLITFFMFLLVVSRIYEPMAFSLQNLAAMNSLQINIDRMNEIENCSEQNGKKEFRPNGYDISFENVGFAYSSDETVLRNVSFTAKQGEVTALIGPSGGGKSTAAKLAARFWDADSGKITVGGVDVKSVDPEQLLTAFSIVFQDVTLFNNTVMENIRIGKKDATDDEVMEAARLANCEEFIEKLPDKWNSFIGENGSSLSGGERQRISIARAFLKDAPIILLDEATASLDVENETVIQSALSRLIKDKTVLLIAHRMRTVSGADKVVVLSDGKAAEQGQPNELLGQNGIYARMVKLQTESQSWSIG